MWLTEELQKEAWGYFKKYSDKIYSFTDCTSFVLMKEKNILEYFSFDEDFRRAGFTDFYERCKES
ncbi:MAG: type II toxin-antitoxin system VapC family toxin [Nitrospirae bacterium]|nr:type II toxin-antitoxin system VapC family toxin [Nitrospirota bacterium]